MGKQKRQRQKPHKENPTGLSSVKDFEEIECTNGDRETALQNVYTEVQSCNLEEKLCALQTLESMACDSSMAVQIAKEGIAKIIGPLLIDQNVAIRVATASTLRQIAEEGGKDAYTSLSQDDIMTPLSRLLKQYYSLWQPNTDCKGKEMRDEQETFLQAVTLLWTLCENSESIVKCANDEDLTSVLIKFLNIGTYGIEIVTITTQCLLSLSEDNKTAIRKIKHSESILHHLLDLKVDESTSISEVFSLKTSVAGLLININSYADQIHIFCKILLVLSEVLAVDHKDMLCNLISILPHEKNSSSSNKKKKIQENRRMLGAQQQALEILANLCFDETVEPNDSDIDDSDNDSDSISIEAECLKEVSMNDDLKMVSTFSVELTEIINNCHLVDKIWEKTAAVDKDNWDILDQNAEGKAVLKQIHTLRCRAYLCMNNLMSNFEVDTLGGIDKMHRQWLEIGTSVFQDNNLNDIELLEAATAAMRAILQRLAEMHVNVFQQLTMTDIQPMLNGGCQSSNANIRANLIRMLGNLALIIMNNDTVENQELVKNISMFLLDICLTENQAWVIAENLDAIMDIYAEDETDRLAADIELIPKLQVLLLRFKNKVRQQRKNLGDNASIISTVNMNLMRFIKYKEKQIRYLQ